jgi:glycosidase
MWQVMKFWLDMGIDGFRLDAVPMLVEREGTRCENLPETHAIIKDYRRRIDLAYPNKMLLAEANQWPTDVISYFGLGDEFHMAFHFPLMPRMFMAVKLEDRKPIIDILEQTPPIPEICQWCGHSAAAGSHDGKRPEADRADEWIAAIDAGHAGYLLRRRNWHGGQHISRRPKRRAHANAVERGMERRVFRGRSGAAVFAGDFESSVWISGSERGVAATVGAFSAELDEVADSDTQFISGI